MRKVVVMSFCASCLPAASVTVNSGPVSAPAGLIVRPVRRACKGRPVRRAQRVLSVPTAKSASPAFRAPRRTGPVR